MLHPGDQLDGHGVRIHRIDGLSRHLARAYADPAYRFHPPAPDPGDQLLWELLAARADVLLVPHHGSKTSSSAAFLDAVQPSVAIVQAGYRNRFGHPRPDVLRRYSDLGVLVVQIPRCGASTWRSEQPNLVQCERNQRQRYWQHVF